MILEVEMREIFIPVLTAWILLVSTAGCSKESGGPDYSNYLTDNGGVYGETFSGGEFHLGPVDWQETEYHNSCAPYPARIRSIEGIYLAGLENAHNGDGQLCDACVRVTTDAGKSLTLRVVTTGITTPNSIDVSPAAFGILDSGEYPRAMSWHVTKCPDNGENLYYQFQTGANVWWTSLWVRNPALPLDSVEVRSANHPEWTALTRGGDGTYTDSAGFGEGPFTLRVTAIDGQILEDAFDGFEPGGLYASQGQF